MHHFKLNGNSVNGLMNSKTAYMKPNQNYKGDDLMPKKDAKQAALEARASGTAAKLEEELAKTNPSKVTTKGDKPKVVNKKGGGKTKESATQRLAKLEASIARQKEETPSLSLGQDDLAFVYTGKVAGKTAKVREPFLMGQDVALLKPLLEPIVAVANGVLAGERIKAIKDLADDEFVKYAKSTPTDKAKFAYSTLLANEEFRNKLFELNELIKLTYDQAQLTPGRADVVAHDKRTGRDSYMSMDQFRDSRNVMDDGIVSSDHDEQDNPDR
jgi:hypothetical protein